MVVGRLIERAGLQLITHACASMRGLARHYTREDFFAACERYRAQKGEVLSLCRYEAPPGIHWDDKSITAKPTARMRGPFTWRRSPWTRSRIPPRSKTSGPCRKSGRVLHPVLAAGQIEGGIAQGIGYALYEKVVMQDGRMANNQMTNYIMPTAEDVPPIHVSSRRFPSATADSAPRASASCRTTGPRPRF